MSRAKCTDGPWCIPAGEGNELIVCAGDDPNHYGEILFVLHPPAGMKITMAYEDMASMARVCASAPDLLAALRGLVEINEKHHEDVTRIIGRPPDWEDDYLDAARAAIAAATGANHEL